MERKISSLGTRSISVLMILAASFEWSCVEREEPRKITQTRVTVRERNEIPPGKRNPDINEPTDCNPIEFKPNY